MNEIYCGDIRDIAKTLSAQSVNCIVTSPPYFGLRDYQTAKWEGGKAECDHLADRTIYETNFIGSKQSTNKGTSNRDIIKQWVCPKCGAKRIDKQIGLEATPEDYVNTLVGIFQELKRVLRDDGVLFLNLGDTYAANRGYQVIDNKHKDVGNNRGMSMRQSRYRLRQDLTPEQVIYVLQEIATFRKINKIGGP